MGKINQGIFHSNTHRRHGFWEENGKYEMATVLMNWMSARFPTMIDKRHKVSANTAVDMANEFTNLTGINISAHHVLQYWGNLIGKPLNQKGQPPRIACIKDGNGLREDVNAIRERRGFTTIDWSKVVR